ncbi:ABC transporter permease [Vibrio sp. VB16]|uniref:ABC transporter permease n=1 Tax=Vibrio sp. VB16 TaxID=2785746 RepID=UPI0018A0186A|nr:FtsX-like permease family protein [Vibrio sp. VB16]UGA56849.1 ABC transporter permease [Vibrio sp. VB16]
MLIKLAWRNLWRNKLRTGIMLGAMIFGLMGVVTMMGFMSGMVDNMVHNAITWQTSHVQVQNRNYIENPDITDLIDKPNVVFDYLSRNPDVLAWSGRFLVDGMIGSARSTRGVRIIGVNMDSESRVTPILSSITQGESLALEGRNPVLVSQKIAGRLKLRIGSKVVLTFTDGLGEVTGSAFRVRGLFKTPSTTFDDNNVYVRKKDVENIAHLTGVHEIAILMKDEINTQKEGALSEFTAQLRALSSEKNRVRDWTKVQPMLASMIATMGISNVIMLAIFVIAMGFGIVNIMLMSVFERTQEFGVLMAVGMQKHKIFLLIMLETIWLGICGAALGLLASMTMIQVLQFTGLPLGEMAEGLGAYGVDTVLYPRVSAYEYEVIFFTVVFSSIIAALYPARQILKQRPVEAMSEKH